MSFPIDVSAYKPIALDLSGSLDQDTMSQLETNVQIARDLVVFMTAVSGAKGLDGHTGGAYSIAPEFVLADSFAKGNDSVFPTLFDEAGHRVAIQYAMAALNEQLPLEALLHHREKSEYNLVGHPERGLASLDFSSGRLGHMWAFVNGVAMRESSKQVFMLGSDGSMQEGLNAEAARLAVAQGLNVNVLVDNNNVTISGHPEDYLPGFHVATTLRGQGITGRDCNGLDLGDIYSGIQSALTTKGPVAVILNRRMAPGLGNLEGSPKAHGCISVDDAVAYLTQRGLGEAIEFLNGVAKPKSTQVFMGSSSESGKNRDLFGKYLNEILKRIDSGNQLYKVFDSDLEGSCGLKHLKGDRYVQAGIMEQGNFSTAAGYGSQEGYHGIFGTFSAFAEMLTSQIAMARLNRANAIVHFSHAGVDDMADNTCHLGVNIFSVDNGFREEDNTMMYFPADPHQTKAILEGVVEDEGLRFIFSTRAANRYILDADGNEFFAPERYTFEAGKDDVIREGKDGYIVAYGNMLYRAIDVADRLKQEGKDIGVINKSTLNRWDENTMAKLQNANFVLTVEDQLEQSSLGVRLGAELARRGFEGKYDNMGVTKTGLGGLAQVAHQGLETTDIHTRVLNMYQTN